MAGVYFCLGSAGVSGAGGGSLIQQVFEHGAAARLGRHGHGREGGQRVGDGLHQQVAS